VERVKKLFTKKLLKEFGMVNIGTLLVALGVYFITDPQLDHSQSRRLVQDLLACGGQVIMTGTIEPNTHANLLYRAGHAQLLRYGVHCTQEDMLGIAAKNCFGRIIAYRSDYAPTQASYEI